MQLFERPESGETAVIVHINFSRQDKAHIEEFISLVQSAAVYPLAIVQGSRTEPDPRYFVGKGKVEEIEAAINATDADVVLFNHNLSPAQQRNLESYLKRRVLDRTGVILDIFAQRARSHEGKLQVELAQLSHMATRLVRGWTHLERQKGGIGLRGPGETQLETDRRLLGDRIKQIQKRLEKVKNQREQSRRSRKRATIPTVSLVGYTNAGKSSLFNQLSKANVYAEDQLFATLDPTLKRVEVANNTPVVLADTVGFIRDLPHDLVNAFHATLQETREADLILHVVDAHHSDRQDHIVQVEKVIKEVDAQNVPQILVYNKIDLFESDNHAYQLQPRIDRDDNGKAVRVWISAQKQLGLDLLLQVIAEFFNDKLMNTSIVIPMHKGRQRAVLYDHCSIESETINDKGEWHIHYSCPYDQHPSILKKLGR